MPVYYFLNNNFILLILLICFLIQNYCQTDPNDDQSTPQSSTVLSIDGKNDRINPRIPAFNINDFLNSKRIERERSLTEINQLLHNWVNHEKTLLDKVISLTDGNNNNPNKHPNEPNIDDLVDKLKPKTRQKHPEIKQLTNRTIVYKNNDFRAFCENPVIDSVDSNLDGTEIIVFTGDKFFIMENLRYGSGNMIVSGLTKQLLPDFQIKDFRTALIVKEGDMRGHVYAFYKDRTVSAWSPNGLYKIRHSLMFNRYPVHGLPVGGLSAVIDNRNPNNPMLIGFQGKQVYYYEVSDKNISEVKRVDHTESRERFPSDITAGFSLNNGFIYVFKGNKYCVREMIYESTDKDQYCNVWYDIRRFLGCWGQYKPPYSLTNYQSSQQNNDFRRDFCNDLKLNGISNDIDGNIILFRGNQYFLLNHFPYETIFVGSGQISDRWPGFKSTEVDAIVVAAEGRKMRGHLIVFKGNKAERMDNKGNVKIVSKSLTSLRAVLQNNEMISSMMIGLGLNLIKYLSINNSELKIVKNVTYDESTANWPLGVTAGIVLNDDIYLFIGDTYCVRKWKCDDKHTKCCKHWKDIRKLFGC